MSLASRLTSLATRIATEFNAIRKPTTEITAATTLDWQHAIINMDTSGSSFAATLPDNATFSGKAYLIRREGANAGTIQTTGADTIGGAVSKSLDSDAAAIGVISVGDGDWKIVGTSGTVT